MDESVLMQIAESCCVDSDEDIVGLFWIIHELDEHVPSSKNRMAETLNVVRILLSKGMVAGDSPYTMQGYNPWADQRPDSVVDRIRREWLALGREPTIPDIVWFGPGPERLRAAASR